MPRHATPRHYFVSSLLDWIEHESTFIFWLIILNIFSSGEVQLEGQGFLLRFKQLTYIVYLVTFMRHISLSLLMALLTDIILHCLFSKFPRILRAAKIFLIAASALFFAIDTFTVYHYHLPFNLVMLDIVLMTNLREGSEFLADYFSDWHFVAFIAGVIFSLYALRKIYSILQKYKKFLAVMILLGALAGTYTVLRTKAMSLENRYVLFTSSIVPRITFMVASTYTSNRDYAYMLNSSPREVQITAKKRDIPNVIFILGESTNRNHMQLYSYSLPTNPKLSARKDIHIFTDTISPHGSTGLVLQKMFTFYRYGSPGEWFTYTSLFRILNEAGYHTSWLSNQEIEIGGKGVKLYSGQCDNYKFTEENYNWHYDRASYDGRLLAFLDEALKTPSEPNFILLHLLGAHNRYIKRYPPEYAKFSVDDEGGIDGLDPYKKQIRAEYDNAILYNDYVVDDVIRRFEDKNAIVIYISDHGEEVFDSINFFGHGSELPNRNMIEVPFIIWTSPKFRASYPELEARIAASVDKPYMTDDMIHTLLDILGIETPEYDPAKSIINPKFDSSRPRIYAGQLYDKDTGLHALQ